MRRPIYTDLPPWIEKLHGTPSGQLITIRADILRIVLNKPTQQNLKMYGTAIDGKVVVRS